MRVEIIRARSLQTVGPDGPSARLFTVGDVVDLPEIHARFFVANGDARLVEKAAAKVEKSEPIEDEAAAKPARRKR